MFSFCVVVCDSASVPSKCIEVRGQLWELVLSLHHVTGSRTQKVSLRTSVFTYWAVFQPLPYLSVAIYLRKTRKFLSPMTFVGTIASMIMSNFLGFSRNLPNVRNCCWCCWCAHTISQDKTHFLWCLIEVYGAFCFCFLVLLGWIFCNWTLFFKFLLVIFYIKAEVNLTITTWVWHSQD